MQQAGKSPVRVPDEVNFFNLPNPSSLIMTLGSTQPLTEISTRNFHGGKSGRVVGLTTLPPSMSRMSENAGASNSRNHKGLYGLYRENFAFTFTVSRRYLWPTQPPIQGEAGGRGNFPRNKGGGV
jgi:hypothetical protein